MEWDQEQAGERRAGLWNTELLKGRVRIWPKEVSQAVLAARGTAALESESFQEPVGAESGEETPTGRHPPSAFWRPFRFGPRPISSVLTAWQGSCLHPKGSCYLSPGQGCRQDPDNPGKNEQMAFLSQAFGVAAAPFPDCCPRLSQAALQGPAKASGCLSQLEARRWGAGISETRVLCRHPTILSPQKASRPAPLPSPACPFIHTPTVHLELLLCARHCLSRRGAPTREKTT